MIIAINLINIIDIHLINYLHSSLDSWRFERYWKKILIPQQHLRNLARKGSLTKYVFLTDIDIHPSFGLASDLSTFLKNNHCYKCAYVIVPYELETSFNFPSNKTELKQLAQEQHARLYHSKMPNSRNQVATKISM